jgi:asparagine synthase (glutamine-hydrolysing)
MCGICGELSFAGRAPVMAPAMAAMTERLPHRGPDHGAVFTTGNGEAALGFRRLSIIDLRAAANQPIGN